MKKVLPFIFPLTALVVVLVLAFRWYAMNTPERSENEAIFGEGVQIEDLSDEDQAQVIRGTGDYKSVPLTGNDNADGQVRYELKDGKVRFSVMADLPKPMMGQYQVWLSKGTGGQTIKAFALEDGKGGYICSAALD
jgi:hypothetical protein